MNINSLIQKGSKILKEQKVISHQIDAELLLSMAIGKDRAFLLTNGDSRVSKKHTFKYLNFISRRKKHEPVSYIIRNKEFWSLSFNVNKSVLIPRPESEIIVEQVVKKFKKRNSLSILDIGTGSGCILLSILKELKKSYGVGIDKSAEAVNIASKNSKKLNLMQRSKFIHCNIDKFEFGNYDVIISNPPYICTHRISSLSEDIKKFEPKIALDGGSNGLDLINKVILKAKKLLKNGGSLFMEIGNAQALEVTNMFIGNGFKLVKKFTDYGKSIRCIMGTKFI